MESKRDITFRAWLTLWRDLVLTIIRLLLWPFVLLAKGILCLAKTRPLLLCAIFALICAAINITSCIHYRLERDETSLVVDSISAVNEQLRATDRYEAGYSAGMAAQAAHERD